MKKTLNTILYIVYEINCNFPTIVFYIFHNNLEKTFRALMSELSRNILKLKHFLYFGFLLILHGKIAQVALRIASDRPQGFSTTYP